MRSNVRRRRFDQTRTVFSFGDVCLCENTRLAVVINLRNVDVEMFQVLFFFTLISGWLTMSRGGEYPLPRGRFRAARRCQILRKSMVKKNPNKKRDHVQQQ